MTPVIAVDQFLPHPPERVWQALVDPDRLAAWFMPSDFKPVVGHRFTFERTHPPDRDLRLGPRILCTVLELRPAELMSWGWTEEDHPGELDTTVTWTLRPEGTGTRLFLEHHGFDAGDPVQRGVYDLMSRGWRTYVGERLAGHLASDPDA